MIVLAITWRNTLRSVTLYFRSSSNTPLCSRLAHMSTPYTPSEIVLRDGELPLSFPTMGLTYLDGDQEARTSCEHQSRLSSIVADGMSLGRALSAMNIAQLMIRILVGAVSRTTRTPWPDLTSTESFRHVSHLHTCRGSAQRVSVQLQVHPHCHTANTSYLEHNPFSSHAS